MVSKELNNHKANYISGQACCCMHDISDWDTET